MKIHSEKLKALVLALWLWLPTLFVLGTDQVASAGDVLALLGFSLFILAAPLLLLPRLRHYFLLMWPLALLAGPYSFLTYFFHSVPGDALLLAALDTSWAQKREVVMSFGWIVLLVPLSAVAYAVLAWSLPRQWRLGREGRQRLLAALLLYAAVGVCSKAWLSHAVPVPPLMEASTANLAFPSSLFLAGARVLNHTRQYAHFGSVHGKFEDGQQPLLVVMVIGESLRVDHLGINGYARNTTPGLAALGPDLLSFRDAVATANSTSLAVADMVLSQTDRGLVPLVQTFREAGFQTAWISNQEPNYMYSGGAHVAEHADNALGDRLRGDNALLPLFGSFVRQAGPRQFVVLHIHGSHYPYDDRYDAEARVFTPTLTELGKGGMLGPADKQAAINSYDNTVAATDRFLSKVIAVLSKENRPAVFLFASDHGENLFDDERALFMHAQREPSTYDLRVPLLVWMNQQYRSRYPQLEAGLRANQGRRIGHTRLFPTMLELGRVGWQGADPHASFAAPGYQEPVRIVKRLGTTPFDFDAAR